VVRNACIILGDLGDPELPTQLRAATRHADSRVQQAAITAILRSNAGGRGEVLAEALPYLHASVQEMALVELMILKDPATAACLEDLFHMKNVKAGVLGKAVIALAAIPSNDAAEGLYRILADSGQALPVRRAALGSLYSHPSAGAVRLLARLPELPPDDPLAGELS